MKTQGTNAIENATVAEQVDAPNLKSGPERGEGSSPSGGTHETEHMLELARKAIIAMDARKDEDIDEWAKRLAASVAELND